MRWILLVGGGLLMLSGAIWALQGLNILVSASPMTGQPFWVWAGGLCVVLGAALCYAGWRRQPR